MQQNNTTMFINTMHTAVIINALLPNGYFHAQSGSTFKNSKTGPHSAFEWLLWIAEQTAIISPHSTDWPLL